MTTPWVVVVIALWVAVIGLVVLVLGLSQRLNQVAARATTIAMPGGSRTMGAIAVGAAVPEPTVEKLGLTTSHAQGVMTSVALFLSPGCGPCLALGEAFEEASEDLIYDANAEVVVVTNTEGATRYAHVGRIVLDDDGDVARSMTVPGTPFGIVMDLQTGTVVGHRIPNAVDDVRALIITGSEHAATSPVVAA
jgi:thiol-disulfide isomerase/thioredoxin